jgi:hypothetical protein
MRIRKMGSKIEGGDAFCDHRFGEILGECTVNFLTKKDGNIEF